MPQGVFTKYNSSLFKKGHPGGGSKGKHWKVSEQGRKNMSESHKGIKHTDDYKKRQSIIMKEAFRTGRAKISDKQKEIARINQTGYNNSNWNGGITPIYKKLRGNPLCKYWRNEIYKKYNFVCQKCNVSGGNLNAHHINNFADFPELRFDINNGIILCYNCHKLFHKKYGKKNNTKEQLEEFLIA